MSSRREEILVAQERSFFNEKRPLHICAKASKNKTAVFPKEDGWVLSRLEEELAVFEVHRNGLALSYFS